MRAIVWCGLGLMLLSGGRGLRAEAPPVEWIEPETGHRVIRLSTQPGSKSLYFHQYPFSEDGRWMVMTTPEGIAAVDLETREVKTLVSGRVRMMVTGRVTGDAYYLEQGWVKAVDLASGAIRTVAQLPEGYARSSIAVNADETILVGVATDPDGESKPRTGPSGGGRLGRRWSAGAPMVIFTLQIESGLFQIIHRSHEWLNHLQCSPTEPDRVLFCHEGPWHFVDRVWQMRLTDPEPTLVHRRTMEMEIAGHEFFGPDGQTVWYDLQTPKSLVFWLANYDPRSGVRTWYHHQREEWSVHYNISPDGTLLAGDGGGPGSVANRSPHGRTLDGRNGQWIYLFRPRLLDSPLQGASDGGLVRIGTLSAERLVDLGKHDYDLEPNVIFTPDGKWIVFRSNMHGEVHTYMVEVAKSS